MTTLRQKPEDSLKAVFLALAVILFTQFRAEAQPAPLLVGAVRDTDGNPVAGATVTARDVRGALVGSGQTDDGGTFAVALSAAAATVQVSCAYCVTGSKHVGAQDDTLVFLVTRFRALAQPGLSQRDLAALPYDRPADAIGLLPYMIPSANGGTPGSSVSDRGLDLGYSLVLDRGVPNYDLALGANTLASIPDRALTGVTVLDASQAFRYGQYAGGGTFVLDDVGQSPGALAADTGIQPGFAAYRTFGGITPSLAASWDTFDGLARRRAGLDYQGDFAGGVLRVTTVDWDQQPITQTPGNTADGSLLAVAYATASRNYRTDIDGSLSRSAYDDTPASGSLRSSSSAAVARFRVQHPGPVTTEAGIVEDRYTGSYVFPSTPLISGQYGTDLAYVAASSAGSAGSFVAGYSVARIGAVVDWLHLASSRVRALPSFSGKLNLGSGLAFTASASSAFSLPTLAGLALAPPATKPVPLEDATTLDAGLAYDSLTRVKLETTVLSESLSGFERRQTTGVGASVTWQVAPLISLRAWTLHDAATEPAPPAGYQPPPFLPAEPLALSRAVLWASYENPAALRLDAIVHRDALFGPPETDIDGDVVVPLAHGIAATVGSSRVAARRIFYAGLRLR
jgi:hypothetical protein